MLSLSELENAMASNRAAKADVEREIAELRDRRKKLLLTGDVDAIEEIDRQIRRHGIEIEIADEKAVEVRGDLYWARENAKRYAGVAMPSDDELERLLSIVTEAVDLPRLDSPSREILDEFRRAFYAVGRLGRLPEPSTDRYFVSSIDDANEILVSHRLQSIEGDILLAAAIAWGDCAWRAADKEMGGQLEIALSKLHSGSPARAKWREILAGEANLLAPLPPRGAGASTAAQRF
jgi:hypothetical protein